MTRHFARILVPIDFSAASDGALAEAKTMAERFGASLHLLHVLDDPYTTAAFSAELYVPIPTGLRESWQKSAGERLATRLTPGEQVRFRSTTEVVFGLAAKVIVEYADDHDIDLVVMGTHGRSGVAHLFLGSVAECVVRTAPCPVLTVRDTRVAERHVVAVAETTATPLAM